MLIHNLEGLMDNDNNYSNNDNYSNKDNKDINEEPRQQYQQYQQAQYQQYQQQHQQHQQQQYQQHQQAQYQQQSYQYQQHQQPYQNPAQYAYDNGAAIQQKKKGMPGWLKVILIIFAILLFIVLLTVGCTVALNKLVGTGLEETEEYIFLDDYMMGKAAMDITRGGC